MSVLPARMSVCHAYVWCLWSPEGDVIFPGTGGMNGCELPCRCWELNQGPLEEQKVLLTTKPSLQPWSVAFLFRLLILLSFCLWTLDSWSLLPAPLFRFLCGTFYSAYLNTATIDQSGQVSAFPQSNISDSHCYLFSLLKS